MSIWPRNQWYVAAWDSEVDRKPLARTICGETLLFYRRLDRSVVAMRDACPHRMLPLSMGIKEGDNIRCRYHGLLLDSCGQLLEMPQKKDRVNERICVETFVVEERHRFIWVWLGERHAANAELIPDLWPCSTPGWTFDGGYYSIQCDYRLLIDNLLDLTHETHVHNGSIGQPELLEAPIETKVDGDSVFVSRWLPGIDAPPFWRGALKKPGLVDRWQICQYLAPASVIIDVGVAPVAAGASLEKHDQGVRGFVIDSMTPESAFSTHYFWGMARDFDIDDPGFTARFKQQQAAVFKEDVEILEAQQRAILANPTQKLSVFNIDSGSVRARRIIERLVERGAAAEAPAQ